MKKINKIIILGLISEIIYISLFCLEIWRRYLGESSLITNSNNLFFIFSGLISIAFFAYLFASPNFQDKKYFRLGIIFFIIFNITLFLTPPLTSNDSYTYIHTSRVLSVHHANPYLFAYNDFTQDSFYPMLKNCWSDAPTPYAPLFTIISTILTFIGQKYFWLSLYLFKLLFMILNMSCCFLIWKITKSETITLLYAWNPLILFELVANSHNDILTIFFLLLSLLFALKKFTIKNYLFGLFFLLCSVLIKFVTAFFLPIYFFIALKENDNTQQRIKIFVYSTLISLLTLLIFYLPFWHGLDTFSRIIFHTQNIYSAWFFSSPLPLIIMVLLGTLGFKDFISLGALSGKIIFIFSYLTFIGAIIKHKKLKLKTHLILFFLICLTIFYATFFNWLMPWYFTVLITLLILYFYQSQNKYYLWASHALTFYGILYYLLLR